MSFIAYLCWLLGISAPSDCDANSYQGWVTNACDTAEEGNVDATKDQGQHNDAPRHARASNINVSI
jgi:hypothetical protein